VLVVGKSGFDEKVGVQKVTSRSINEDSKECETLQAFEKE
jgi:hypothetical protein